MNTRRSFMGTILSALTPLWWRSTKVEQKPEESHYFDWGNWVPESTWPYTTDPKWEGKLTVGLCNHVSCDGVEYLLAARFVTGPNGWIEYLDSTKLGAPFNRVYGHVRFWVDE